METGNLRNTLKITKACADRQRLRILLLLRGGELCVCQIVAVLKLAPSTISEHLSLLHKAHLVASRKDGRWMHYRLHDNAKARGRLGMLLRWLSKTLEDDPVIQADQKLLNRILKTDREELCRKQRK